MVPSMLTAPGCDAQVQGGAVTAVGAGEDDHDGVAAVLLDRVPAGTGAAFGAADLAGLPVDAEGALVVAGGGLGLGRVVEQAGVTMVMP